MNDLYTLIYATGKKYGKISTQQQTNSVLFNKILNILGSTITSYEFSRWNSDVLPDGVLYSIFTETIMDLPEKVINGKGETEILTENHYLIEQFRIPLKNKPTFINVLKIAWTAGLLHPHLKIKDYPEGIVKNYRDLHVHHLINYLSDDEIKQANTLITDTVINSVKKEITTYFKQGTI